MRIKLLLLSLVIVVAAGGTWFGFRYANASNKSKHSSSTTTSSSSKSTPIQPPSFNKQQYSLTDPTSIWVIVNKQHPLQPVSYIPPDLTVPNVPLASPGAANMQMRAATAAAITQMFTDAKQDNIKLMVVSGYRSYTYQQSVYGGYVKNSGQTIADQESARPGYSEHQTGFAVDIGDTNNDCTLEQCFATTPAGEWLAANAYKYGFLLRYPADKVAVTGYEYEPWHFRYIGTALSNELYKENIQTLEEFFGASGGTTYNSAS